MVRVTIYVEGGGQGKLRGNCREGFSGFFQKAGLSGYMPKVVACGSRDEALKRFRIALDQAMSSDDFPLLLVDSEEPVRRSHYPWEHLYSRDQWNRPKGAREEHAQLMVQVMESWFLADVTTLESYFGPGFRSASIPTRIDLENIPKEDVYKQLNLASSNSRKGKYHKGRHSFDILARIDPKKVTQRSHFAQRLIDTLKIHLIPA